MFIATNKKIVGEVIEASSLPELVKKLTKDPEEYTFTYNVQIEEDEVISERDAAERVAAWFPSTTFKVSTPQDFIEMVKVHNERMSISKDPFEKAVDPDHYKGYVDDLQWIEVMSRLPTLKDPSKFMAALELQVRKYLDRNGQKDATAQEIGKALFYLKAMKYVAEKGTPIVIEEFKKY